MNDQTKSGGPNGQVANEMERLLASASDSLTDDMVTRLSATVTDGLDLLDRVNRSGIGDALPAISQMVKSGDLQRIVDLGRLLGSAEDSMSDDIVVRLSEMTATGMDLLDRVNRSGIARALPAITQLVENGDLDRLVGLARLIASIEDSISDDIVDRLASVATGVASLVDKLARNEGFLRLVDVLGRDEVQCALVDVADATCAARAEAAQLPPMKGGIGGLYQLAKDPATQESLRFVGLVAKRLRKS